MTVPGTSMIPMNLSLFLRRSTRQERAEVAAVCNSSVGYLYQIAGGHRFASPLMAIRIEGHTCLVAGRSNGRLAAVPRSSMVRHPEIFQGPFPASGTWEEVGVQGHGAGEVSGGQTGDAKAT